MLRDQNKENIIVQKHSKDKENIRVEVDKKVKSGKEMIKIEKVEIMEDVKKQREQRVLRKHITNR